MVVAKLLDEIPFFQAMTDREKLRIVEGQSFFEGYEPGEFIIKEGERNDALYVVIKGTALVTKRAHPEHVIATLQPGAIFGELSFLTGRPRSTNIVTSEKLICFVMNSAAFNRMDVGFQLKVKDELIKILVARLDDMNAALLESYSGR